MTFSQTNTTNPLHIKKIARNQIDLVVNRDGAGRAVSFVVNALTLEELELPPDGRIKVFAYSKSREQVVDLGTVRQPGLGMSHALKIDTGGPFHFRVIVRDAAEPKVIASCEGLRATEETDEAGRQHLLPVEPSDNLEEKLWEVRFDGDGNPVLYVNSDADINMLARMRGDPIFQALILPQAVEQVLLALTQYPDEVGESWQGRWNAYLAARGVEHPEDPGEDEECRDWARAEAQRFAGEHRFRTQARAKLLEGGYGD